MQLNIAIVILILKCFPNYLFLKYINVEFIVHCLEKWGKRDCASLLYKNKRVIKFKDLKLILLLFDCGTKIFRELIALLPF